MSRLEGACDRQELSTQLMYSELPPGSPSHSVKPYAFKAYALMDAMRRNYTTLLWCDACILPVRDMEPLFKKIETDGVWFSRNGWMNSEWTADSAYAALFPAMHYDAARVINAKIPHVVATAFGIDVSHAVGRAFLADYFRLASETSAFCGPWTNTVETPCGPYDVRGHRHDQTAASVIAWRLGVQLTDPPDIFSYPPVDERTVLLADGAYE